ncbi:MAG: hypothetical protein ACI4LX_11665 [Treponema sp.]
MDNKLCAFIYMSKYAGMREDLVQAGGGNSSVKFSPEKMLIKASGFQLADIAENTGFCTVNPQIINAYFGNNGIISQEAEKSLLSDSLCPPCTIV